MFKNVSRVKPLSSAVLCLSLLCVILSWFQLRPVQMQWGNIPPPPSSLSAPVIALGDTQWAYRIYAIFLQNMGEVSGRNISFTEYNYQNLTAWLRTLYSMDNQSSYMPFLAAFYYGNVKDPDKLRLMIDFLATVGERPGHNNWRWLGQAIALARFELKDNALALRLSYKLAALNEPDMPGWTKQMPAFILNNMGDKAGAYTVMLKILQSNAEQMHPNEVFFMRDYICTRLQTDREARANPLCQNTVRNGHE